MRVYVAVLAGLTALAAAEPKTDLEPLIKEAQSLPPEFAADALIRIAGLPAMGDDARRRALLEDAFQRAAGAQEAYARTPVASNDPSLVFLRKAYSQQLDALSLEVRVVRALLPLDKAKARELFSSIPPLHLAELTCSDPLVYDVSSFYEVLGQIANSGFTAKEVAGEEQVKFLQRYVAGLQSPAQIGPLAGMLAGTPLRPEQFALLVAEFGSVLRNITADPRSFSVSEARGAAEGRAILALAQACRKQQADTAALLEAYREYLVHHLTGPACAPPKNAAAGVSFGIFSSQAAELSMNALEFFNSALVAEAPNRVKPLEAGDVRPSKVLEVESPEAGCRRQICRDVAAQYRDLILGENGLPFSGEQRASDEWRVKLTEYLGKLGEWVPANGAEYRRKCQAFNDLIALAPAAADREAVLRAFVSFLAGNPYAAEHRVEWFLPVNTLIARVFADPQSLSHVAQELLGSGNSVMRVYARLEQLAPRSPEVYMPLM